jgi:hypothetical protein
VRCRRASLQSQEHRTTQDRALVGTRYTAKDGSKKSTLAGLAQLIKVLAPVATLTGSSNSEEGHWHAPNV